MTDKKDTNVKPLFKGIKSTRNEDWDEDQPDLLKLFGKESKVITRALTHKEHYYPFHGYIENFEDYDDLIELLLTVPEGDVVRIYISSNGGRLDVADLIVARISEAQQRNVQVIAELGQSVASAATFIALACSEIYPSPHCQFSIHPWSSGVNWGFAKNQYDDVTFNKKQSDRFMKETYSGFLTEEEMESVLQYPRDLCFDAEEVMERWGNYQVFQQEQYQKMVDEVKAQQEAALKPAPKKAVKKTK